MKSFAYPCASPNRTAASPRLSNPSELRIFAFEPASFISSHHLSQTHFTNIDDILSSHVGSRCSSPLARYSPSYWSCIHLLPTSPRVSQSPFLQACFYILATRTSLLSEAAVGVFSGPHRGTELDYPLSKRAEGDHRTP